MSELIIDEHEDEEEKNRQRASNAPGVLDRRTAGAALVVVLVQQLDEEDKGLVVNDDVNVVVENLAENLEPSRPDVEPFAIVDFHILFSLTRIVE